MANLKKNKNTNENDDLDLASENANHGEENFSSLWCPICRDVTIFIDGVCTGCGFKKSISKTNDTNATTEEYDLTTNEVEDYPDDFDLNLTSYDPNDEDDDY